jgi:hypothetical protein
MSRQNTMEKWTINIIKHKGILQTQKFVVKAATNFLKGLTIN